MQTGQHQHSHHGCEGQSRGPEVFYGYCHETNRMRMMDYTDYHEQRADRIFQSL